MSQRQLALTAAESSPDGCVLVDNPKAAEGQLPAAVFVGHANTLHGWRIYGAGSELALSDTAPASGPADCHPN